MLKCLDSYGMQFMIRRPNIKSLFRMESNQEYIKNLDILEIREVSYVFLNDYKKPIRFCNNAVNMRDKS